MRISHYFSVLLFLITIKGHAMDLNQFKWKNRVLILNSGVIEENKIQVDIFNAQKNENNDRDLLLLKTSDTKLINSLSLKKNKFSMVLIGKDGSVKNRYESITEMNKIYELIDSMPMRQVEIKAK